MSDAKTITLPCHGIVVELTGDGGGSISSDLHAPILGIDDFDDREMREYNAAIDALESIILAHACAGINIESPAYIEGIETAVQAIVNHY